MSIQQVNLGTYSNDGTGDDLRTAFEKVIYNFNELDLTRVIDADNAGTGAPIYISKDSNTLVFRTFKEDGGIVIGVSGDEILLDASLVNDTNPKLGATLDLNNFNIEGTGDINVTGSIFTNEYFVGTLLGTVTDISNHGIHELFDVGNIAPLTGQVLVYTGTEYRPTTIVNKLIPGPNITLTPGTGVGEVEISSTGGGISNSIDFGSFSGALDPLQLLLQATPIDFGSFTSSSSLVINGGGILGNVPPTYVLTSNVASVSEGNGVIITLTTSNLPDSTLVPYTITGVTSDDITGMPLIGSFLVTSNQGTLTIDVSSDTDPETESIIVTLNGTEYSITIPVVDAGVYPSEIDGGLPGDTAFDLVADCGTPFTAVFDTVLDGGEISSLIITSDGGSPGTVTFTSTADCGLPSTSMFDEVYDGGLI